MLGWGIVPPAPPTTGPGGPGPRRSDPPPARRRRPPPRPRPHPQAPANSTRYPQDKNYEIYLFDEKREIEIEVSTLSQVLAEHPEVTTIDLVKIDVEGAEQEVLTGMSDADWDRSRAFVIEVDDVDGRLGRIEE